MNISVCETYSCSHTLREWPLQKKKQNIAEAETYFKAKLYYRNDIERLEKKFDNTYVE